MTIASEIQRLQWAKADIKIAIESKDVAVPSSAKLDEYAWYVSQIVSGKWYVIWWVMQWTVITTGQWWWNNYWWTIWTAMSVIQKDWNLFGIAAWRHYTSSSNDWVCYWTFGKQPNQAFYWWSTPLITSSADSYYESAWWQDSTDLSKLKLKLVYRWSGSWTTWTKYYNYMDIDIDAWTITQWEAWTENYSWDNNPLPANWVSIDPSNIPWYTNWWAKNITTVRWAGDEYYLTFTLA